MDYRILGSFEVRVRGRPVGLGGEKPRALLALLLLHRNEVVSTDRLIDELWGEAPPPTALGTLRAYVSRLRKALNGHGELACADGESAAGSVDGVLLTRGRGYLLRVAAGELDLERVREMADRGHEALAAGDPARAATVLSEALGLWRGPPLADFAYEPFAQAAIAELDELRLVALEDRVEADLALGRSRELVGELRDLVARHPLRERLRGQLMLALYRSGRQAEALEIYQEFRRTLAEELGLEPGPSVQQLERAVLHRDPALDLARTAEGSSAALTGAPDSRAARLKLPRRTLASVVLALLSLALVVLGVIIATGDGRTALPAIIPGNSIGAVSLSGAAVQAVVPLRTAPSAVADGAGAVWAANSNAGTVSRIDPVAGSVVATIPVGTAPTGLAFGGGAMWVTNNYGETVSRIDPDVNRVVQTIPVGNAPTGVAVGYGSVWVANSSDGTLSRINVVTGRLVRTIKLGASVTDVAVGAGAVWVSDEAVDHVFRVDPESEQATASINVGTGPTALAAAFGSVWVTNSLDGTVSRIDPATNAVTATVAVGDGASAIAIGDGAVWISNQYAGTVARIDPVADAVMRTLTVGNRPQGLALAAGLLWVGARPGAINRRGGTLKVLATGNADSFDPVLTQNIGVLLPLAYDGLTAYQRVGGSGSVQLVPDLAVSLPSPTDGGRTYTFRLRSGVRYSNGEPVKPEDFRRALERDLILGGNPFADVLGGAACRAHPSHCDLSRGVLTDDAANTVTFRLVTPNPEFLDRLTFNDAFAVPAGTPNHDLGLHPMPATGAYKWVVTSPYAVALVRNPYFHEWSHAARPDGYPDRIVFRHIDSASTGLSAVEQGSADYIYDGVPRNRLSEVQTRFAGRLYVTPTSGTLALILNTRVSPFNDVQVRRAVNYAVDRAKVASLLGQDSQPACQILPVGLPGYRRYCPYTRLPNLDGTWRAPNLKQAQRLITASGTRGRPVTIWNLNEQAWSALDQYLVSLLDRLGFRTQVKDVSGADPKPPLEVADSRTGVQSELWTLGAPYPSASLILQGNFSCQSFVPNAGGNPNWSQFCDHRLDAQINNALAAERDNSPDTAALWAKADRTATNLAPAVPLTTTTDIHLVSARVGNYQYSFPLGTLIDQLWVR